MLTSYKATDTKNVKTAGLKGVNQTKKESLKANNEENALGF